MCRVPETSSGSVISSETLGKIQATEDVCPCIRIMRTNLPLASHITYDSSLLRQPTLPQGLRKKQELALKPL